MYYYRARYYSADTGRFINEDPLGFGAGISFYSYVEDDPINLDDPTGLRPHPRHHCKKYGSCYGPDNPKPKCSILNGCFKYHGRWCGPYWTGGWVELYDPTPTYDPPIDDLDTACMHHDICYYTCRQSHPCDQKARGTCMTSCHRALAAEAASHGDKLSSPLWWWMQYNDSPDPGPNAKSCPQCPHLKSRLKWGGYK